MWLGPLTKSYENSDPGHFCRVVARAQKTSAIESFLASGIPAQSTNQTFQVCLPKNLSLFETVFNSRNCGREMQAGNKCQERERSLKTNRDGRLKSNHIILVVPIGRSANEYNKREGL